MIVFKNQRIAIFIDAQNLYHSAKNLYRARVNFKELIKSLTLNRQLIRAIAYVVKTESTLGEESFFEALNQAGIELRIKEIQTYPDGTKKADWDVGLAIDAIRMANFIDVIILVTGDGDFLPLIEYLKWGLGKQVELSAFSKVCSGRLKEAADYFISLENIPKILLRKGKA